MTAQQQNMAIFGSQGWVYVPPVSTANPFVVGKENLPRWRKGRKYAYLDEIPHYTEDLNAMHEAVSRLKGWHQHKYAENLMDVCQEHPIGTVPCWDTDRKSLFVLMQATAAQRAEAYLKTLNLWTE